nr:glutathione S-transferase [Saccharina japonica]
MYQIHTPTPAVAAAAAAAAATHETPKPETSTEKTQNTGDHTETDNPPPAANPHRTPPIDCPVGAIALCSTYNSHFGWVFANPDDPPFLAPGGYGHVASGATIPDPLHGFKTVREIYDMAVGEGELKKYTVPVLWDEKTKKVVNNESSEIIEILNSAFNDVEGVGNPGLDLEPKAGKEEAFAKEVDGWMYDEVCNGVYKAGFAKTQDAYEHAVTSLFKHLEMCYSRVRTLVHLQLSLCPPPHTSRYGHMTTAVHNMSTPPPPYLTALRAWLEQVLSTRRYLAGDRVTLSDVRVFPSLVRFDEVYNVYFKCNKKRIADFPNILNYLRDLYQTYPEGFASTTEMDHIRKHYYTSHPALNTYAIVPIGPDFLSTLKEPHNRDRVF